MIIFSLVGAANVIDKLVFGQADTLRTAVIFFYIANESLSIIENAIKLNVPIPEVLKEKLAQIRGQEHAPAQERDLTRAKIILSKTIKSDIIIKVLQQS